MKIILLIAAVIGLGIMIILGKTMETNDLIMLCTTIILLFIAYTHDSLEKIKK